MKIEELQSREEQLEQERQKLQSELDAHKKKVESIFLDNNFFFKKKTLNIARW